MAACDDTRGPANLSIPAGAGAGSTVRVVRDLDLATERCVNGAMASSASTEDRATNRERLSSPVAGMVAAASFVVPATCALIAVVIAPDFALNYVALVVAAGFGILIAVTWWDRPRLLEISRNEVRVLSLRRSWPVPVVALTEAAVVPAMRWENTKSRGWFEVHYEHLYLTFRLPHPAERDEVGPLPRLTLPRLTLDATRDPDPSATAAAVRTLATSPTLTVRVTRRGDDLLARLIERCPELEVRRPSLQSRRVRGGWSDAYLPETTDPPNSRPLWALENVQWLDLDGGLREWGIALLAVLAFLDWIGGVALLMNALN